MHEEEDADAAPPIRLKADVEIGGVELSIAGPASWINNQSHEKGKRDRSNKVQVLKAKAQVQRNAKGPFYPVWLESMRGELFVSDRDDRSVLLAKLSLTHATAGPPKNSRKGQNDLQLELADEEDSWEGGWREALYIIEFETAGQLPQWESEISHYRAIRSPVASYLHYA